MFDVAVILINYNSSQHTINCVRSIIEKTSKSISFQIIITDNCSETSDYLALKAYFEEAKIPNLELLRSPINTGFGGGNMYGIPYAKATYLAIVNNDTLFKNDCLTILKETLDKNKTIGIAGAQAYKENGDFLISLDHFASPAREILGRKFLEMSNPKKYPNRKKRYNEPVKVNFVPGSFMFLRTSDFEAVNGFDTSIFLYYEETDLCLRLSKIGKFAYLVPQAEFVHFHGASTGKSLAIKKELKISLLYIIRKHYGYLAHKLVLSFLIIKYFFSSILKPKNWPLFNLLINGAPLSKSLKNKQKIVTI
jgi:GT2 family glycosyltransferase